MGFFSWKTSDTDRSICNSYSGRDTFTVYMLSPDGKHLEESEYEGYGVFGGVDAYVHLARMNAPDECNGDDEHDRAVGLDLAFGEDPPKYPLKFVEKPVPYEYAAASENCDYQGYFYDDEEDDE